MFWSLLTSLWPVLSIYFFLVIIFKFNNDLGKKVTFYYKFFIFYFSIFLSSIVFLPIFIFRPTSVLNGIMFASIIKHITKLVGVKWHVRNAEHLTGESGAVIISNHQSVIDAIGIFQVWETAGKVRIIMKKELFLMGLFGLTAYLGGGIFINRKDSKSAQKTLEATTEALVKQQSKIWIFPEGTRKLSTDNKLLPFKKGAFNMAVAAQVSILPVVISPYYFLNSNKYIFDDGHIFLQCLEPVSTVGLTLEDVPELVERLHGSMSSAYEKLCNEVTINLQSNKFN